MSIFGIFGKTTPSTVSAHILDPKTGYSKQTWTVGQHVQREAVEKLSEAGNIYVVIAYEAGAPKQIICKREIWNQTKAQFASIEEAGQASMQSRAAAGSGLQTFSRQGAKALSTLFGLAGREVILYKDHESLPGSIFSAKDPRALFFSVNPTRSLSFIVGYQWQIILKTVIQPNSTSLYDNLLEVVNSGITDEELKTAEDRFGREIPTEVGPEQRRARLVDEVARDVDGLLRHNPQFLRKMFAKIQNKYGLAVAKDSVAKLADSIRAQIESIKALFETDPYISEQIVSKLQNVWAVLAATSSGDFNTPNTPANSRDRAEAKRVDGAVQAIANGDLQAAKKILISVIQDVPAECPYQYEREDGTLVMRFWDRDEFMQYVTWQKPAKSIHWLVSVYPRAFYYLGYIAVHEGKYQTAIEYLDRGAMLEPTNPKIKIETAQALLRSGSHAAALQLYEQIVSVGPFVNQNNVAVALRGKGYALVELGRLADAERAFKASLELEPQDKVAHNELLYIARLRRG